MALERLSWWKQNQVKFLFVFTRGKQGWEKIILELYPAFFVWVLFRLISIFSSISKPWLKFRLNKFILREDYCMKLKSPPDWWKTNLREGVILFTHWISGGNILNLSKHKKFRIKMNYFSFFSWIISILSNILSFCLTK